MSCFSPSRIKANLLPPSCLPSRREIFDISLTESHSVTYSGKQANKSHLNLLKYLSEQIDQTPFSSNIACQEMPALCVVLLCVMANDKRTLPLLQELWYYPPRHAAENLTFP